jgi:hypothetical protein
LAAVTADVVYRSAGLVVVFYCCRMLFSARVAYAMVVQKQCFWERLVFWFSILYVFGFRLFGY